METPVPFDSNLSIPDSLVTEEVLLRPIRTTDAELDYEAVMASSGFLRTWEQTGWPKDGFTVQENREDVAGLVARHDERAALTFSRPDTEDRGSSACHLNPLAAGSRHASARASNHPKFRRERLRCRR